MSYFQLFKNYFALEGLDKAASSIQSFVANMVDEFLTGVHKLPQTPAVSTGRCNTI